MFTGGIKQSEFESSDTFESLGLSEPILKVLAEVGFERPTPIQAGVIPLALAGRDVVGLAQTGSGKTAAFALPMAERLYQGSGLRGLILCPTRELALQAEAFLQSFGTGERRLRTACLIGGVKYPPQLEALRNGPDIIVATPGRLLDHVERRTARLESIEMLVLDEADHMLDLGFLPQINRILDRLPKERQTMMFSATMPASISRLAQLYMKEPETVDLRPETRVADGIEQRLYLVEPDDKKRCLLALIAEEPGAVLVFVRRKLDADWACRQLELEGHPVEKIHGDRTQSERVRALSGLRQGEHRILVATDIAARGIDIPVIEHIINFDVPQTVEDYVHRAGRTARGAAGGTVSCIASWTDTEMVRQIESGIGTQLPRFEAPGVPAYQERKKTIKGRERVRRRMR
jgi:ATP-dependent RNA helicase RhlE